MHALSARTLPALGPFGTVIIRWLREPFTQVGAQEYQSDVVNGKDVPLQRLNRPFCRSEGMRSVPVRTQSA